MEYERSHAIAYLHKRMPYTYFSFLRILEEVRTRLPKFAPFSLLDYGAGLGSGAWAGIDVFRSLKKVAAVEPSTEMRRVGKFMTKNLQPAYPLAIPTYLLESVNRPINTFPKRRSQLPLQNFSRS